MTAPAGWYDQGDGTQRYWDGAAWTQHTALAARSPASQYAAQPAAAPQYAAVPEYAAQPAAAPVAQPSGYAALPADAPQGAPRKRVWPWVLGIGGGLLLVLIGLAVWGAVAFFGVVSGPVDVVNDFEDALETTDCAAMKLTVSTGFLDSSGWGDCAVFTEDAVYLTPSSFDANNSSIVNGSATVTADIRFTDDTASYIGTYTLVKEDGDWKVDGFNLDASS